MSYQSYTGTPTEDWQDYVLWDEEGYKNPTVTRDDLHHGFLGTGASGVESPYVTSAPPSNYGEPSSFEYNVSAPPSIIGASSSYGQPYGTSPTVSSTATSPLVGRDELRYFGSFGGCDDLLSPFHAMSELPLIDTTRERIFESTSPHATTAGQVFNPHLLRTNGAFSDRDMVTSQILTCSTGTWADQAWAGEAIAEGDEDGALTGTAPIPIIRTQPHSLSNSFESYSQSQTIPDARSRAITIPQPNNHSAKVARPRWTASVPPILSTSPISHRRSRSGTLSRSSSRAEQRKAKASPSPTSAQSLGWVSMQMDSQSGRMAAASSSEGTQGRVPKGRKRGLDPRQRSEAALMRIIGSCSNCKKRKEKCDPGTPCKSCLKHYKGDLVNNPCRNHLLSNLTKAFLSDRHGWHPTSRSLDSCVAPRSYSILEDITYTIPLYFGFGQPIKVNVHPVELDDSDLLVHEHLVYSWPPRSSNTSIQAQAVLPAILTDTAVSKLKQDLDAHLSQLVMNEFSAFPLYCSQLRTLRSVYILFRSLRPESEYSRVLLQALKLLVLVHIGGDIILPNQKESRNLARLIHDFMGVPEDHQPTPCFIRAQFGAMMPDLAHELMTRVLSSLELLLLRRNEDEWPVTLAILIVVLMTVESIQYHSAKRPYHEVYDSKSPVRSDDHLEGDDDAVEKLITFYSACFSACHNRLRPDWKGELDKAATRASSSDTFVRSMREAIGQASPGGYLAKKARAKRSDDEDMGFFFDRLVARLLLPQLHT